MQKMVHPHDTNFMRSAEKPILVILPLRMAGRLAPFASSKLPAFCENISIRGDSNLGKAESCHDYFET